MKAIRAAALVGIAAGAWAQDAANEPPTDLGIVQLDEARRGLADDAERTALIDDTDGQIVGTPINQNKKWIGVVCEPVSDALRAHLDVPERTGLVVKQVMPDSPAAEAGLAEYDVLLSANGVPIKSVVDLIDAIAKAEDGPVELEWLRKGDRQKKLLTPANRPEAHQIVDVDDVNADVDLGNVRQWLENLNRRQDNDGEGMRFRFIGPGMEIKEHSMPNDLRIRIEQKGDNPAKIQVEKGDSSWEITEEDLDELPDDVRPHVERMLGARVEIDLGDDLRGMMRGIPNIDDLNLDLPWPRLEERFEEIDKRMNQMLEQLERLNLHRRFDENNPPEPENDTSNDA